MTVLQSDELWLRDAIQATKEAINKLVLEFVEHPFLHRVEHSLHIRLYGFLIEQAVFAQRHKIGSDGPVTYLVHKEWPAHRLGKDGRGHFDLAILSPSELSTMSIDLFEAGERVPSIVIEMGLNYQQTHLSTDDINLSDWRGSITNGFLVHLDRVPHRPTTIAEVEKTVVRTDLADTQAARVQAPRR
jgi:hypothetical protein